MKDFLFQQTVSYWQYLITCSAVSTAIVMGFTVTGLVLMISILVAGAVIEGTVNSYGKQR